MTFDRGLIQLLQISHQGKQKKINRIIQIDIILSNCSLTLQCSRGGVSQGAVGLVGRVSDLARQRMEFLEFIPLPWSVCCSIVNIILKEQSLPLLHGPQGDRAKRDPV